MEAVTPFHRASNVTDQIDGSGIGLSSTRHVVEQHGGQIDIASEEHIGTTIMVRLPIDVGPALRSNTDEARRQPEGV